MTEEFYNSCKTDKPIKEYKDGNTKVVLDHSGPFYYISGAQGHCEKGQKIKVVVMSENHKPKDNSPAPAPAPASEPDHKPKAPAPGPSADAYGLRGGVLGSLMGLGTLFGVVFLIWLDSEN